MECILFAGIDFDLQLDIPHNYVNRMCKKAFGRACWCLPTFRPTTYESR